MRVLPNPWLLAATLLMACPAHAANQQTPQDALAQATAFVAGEFHAQMDMRLTHAVMPAFNTRKTATGEEPDLLQGHVYALESDPLIAVSHYEIGPPLRDGDSVIVPVDYSVVATTQGVGVLTRQFVKPASHHEQVRLRMVHVDGTWRVKHPPLPHVSARLLRDTLAKQITYAHDHILASPRASHAQRATYTAMQRQHDALREWVDMPTWPVIAPITKRFFVTNEQPHASMVIGDVTGEPLYRLSCHEGEYESADEGDFNHLYQCKLWDMRAHIRGDLFSPTATWNRSRTRASFYGEQVNGACADHTYYGNDRRFRFMGMRICLRIDDLEQPDIRALLRGAKPTFAFTLTANAQPDVAATDAFVGPAPEQCTSYFTIDTSGKMVEKVTIGDDEATTD